MDQVEEGIIWLLAAKGKWIENCGTIAYIFSPYAAIDNDKQKGSRRMRTILKVLHFSVLAIVVFFIACVIYGISERNMLQEDHVLFPFPQTPVVLPGDHAAHPDYKIEWWYYTGHLDGEDGRAYGFELTFFRFRTANVWAGWIPLPLLMYPHGMLAHFAITDVEGDRHDFIDSVQFNSSDNAGADTETFHVWLRDWHAREEQGEHILHAGTEELGLDLAARPSKPAVLHGEGGYHWKGEDGVPSYYISYTRMDAAGSIWRDGENIPVTGQVWMDHEYTSFPQRPTTQGWDWFAIQLDNDFDLMFYQIRRRDGSAASDSTGAIVRPEGAATAITMPAFEIRRTGTWTSPHTGARYPSGWVVTMPEVPAELTVTPLVDDQEMVMKKSEVVYWEGACHVSGTWSGAPITGRAYVELSGYYRAVTGDM